MSEYLPTVLCIAGSDTSAGAGVQADIKAVSANGGYALTVITNLTAQNSVGIDHVEPVSITALDKQLSSVLDDFPVDAIKIGMLGSEGVVRWLAARLSEIADVPVVLDPVLSASSGAELLGGEGQLQLLDQLVPLTTLLTPNSHEAGLLSGDPVTTLYQVETAGRKLVEMGCKAVLVTGGHLDHDTATDTLITQEGMEYFDAPFVSNQNTHGTGCTYASAIATHLAAGKSLQAAIGSAKAYVTAAIQHGFKLGTGPGPTDHFFALRSRS